MNVTLNPDDEKLVNERVQSGQYSDTSAVFTEALRALREREAEDERIRQDLRSKIERGYQQSLRGEGVDGEQFLAELEDEIDIAEQAQNGG